MRFNKEDQVEFEDVLLKHATDKALLCVIDGVEHWFPKSQVHADSELFSDKQVGETGKLVVTEWIAKQKNLI